MKGEFRSRVEDLGVPVRELRFPKTNGFGSWAFLFCKECVAHPAKMNLHLLYYLIRTYTKPGDWVLDPMAGTGSTGILASVLGRNAIVIDIEEKFVEWMRKNGELLEKSGLKRGQYVVLHGDARFLCRLLENVDAIITSPPYHGTEAFEDKEFMRKTKRGDYVDAGFKGSIDTIITSPPYSESISSERCQDKVGERQQRVFRVGKSCAHAYSNSPENIGNLDHETYLEAMLKVYAQMCKCLKRGGRAVVVVKPFIRGKRVVDLPYHTYLLCRKVGFALREVLKFRLPTKSFWRIVYYKKHPEVPVIAHEYVLVFAK